MNRPTGRRKPCDLTHARARLSKARQFLALAAVAADDDSLRSAEASNLIEAGIAAADVICCVRLGERSSDGNHRSAVALLSETDAEASKRLQTLLSMKSGVQYGTDDPSAATLTAARRASGALVAAAEDAVRA